MAVGVGAVVLGWALLSGGQAWAGQSLTEPRYGAVAATLLDGEVLIAGGSYGAPSSAELFNPATNTFTKLTGPGQSLTEARDGAVAATLPNGEVLLAGGSNSNGVLASAELFNPATDTFTKLTGPGQSLTEARYAAVAATLLNGEVLLAGGFHPLPTRSPVVYPGYLASAELFNPATDTFTQLTGAGQSLIEAREPGIAAALPSGKVLIAGGWRGVAAPVPNGFLSVSSIAELFNPVTDTFSEVASSLTARSCAVAAALPPGRVLIAGGNDGGQESRALASAELFNAETDSFTELTGAGQSLTEARECAVAAMLPSGQVLIAGGYNDSSGVLSTAELFNPATDTFTKLEGNGQLEAEAEAKKRQEEAEAKKRQEEAEAKKRQEEAEAKKRQEEAPATKLQEAVPRNSAGVEKAKQKANKKKKKKNEKKKRSANKRKGQKKKKRGK